MKDKDLPAGIDPGILDLVVALNGLPGIVTEGSCQGGGQEHGFEQPYVSFRPSTPRALNRLAMLLTRGWRIEVMAGGVGGTPGFMIVLRDDVPEPLEEVKALARH